MASPRRPKIMEGTAARLLMLTSMISVQIFLGANSSRYMAAATPMGKDVARSAADEIPAERTRQTVGEPYVKNPRMSCRDVYVYYGDACAIKGVNLDSYNFV